MTCGRCGLEILGVETMSRGCEGGYTHTYEYDCIRRLKADQADHRAIQNAVRSLEEYDKQPARRITNALAILRGALINGRRT